MSGYHTITCPWTCANWIPMPKTDDSGAFLHQKPWTDRQRQSVLVKIPQKIQRWYGTAKCKWLFSYVHFYSNMPSLSEYIFFVTDHYCLSMIFNFATATKKLKQWIIGLFKSDLDVLNRPELKNQETSTLCILYLNGMKQTSGDESILFLII